MCIQLVWDMSSYIKRDVYPRFSKHVGQAHEMCIQYTVIADKSSRYSNRDVCPIVHKKTVCENVLNQIPKRDVYPIDNDCSPGPEFSSCRLNQIQNEMCIQ